MPDRLEELVADREARLGVEPALAVNQDVPVVVAPVARRREQLAHGLREDVLAARRVGPCESRVAERLGRDVEENPLVAYHGVPRNAAVDAQVPLAVFRGEEEKEVAATAAEGNRFLDRDVSCVLIGLYDLRVLHRLDERQRRLLEERRIAGVDFKKDVVYSEPHLERDDVLNHAEVVVLRARPEHKVLRARPEVCDIYRCVQLLGEVHAANPSLGRMDLFRSGMNIGQDMVGTMTNTLILAFLGSGFTLIIYLYSLGLSFYQLFSSAYLSIEVISGISSSIGMILAIPLTALISSVLIQKSNK